MSKVLLGENGVTTATAQVGDRRAGSRNAGDQSVPDALVEIGPSEGMAIASWYEGCSSRESVERYLGARRGAGESSRGVLGALRRQVAQMWTDRGRKDLAAIFRVPAEGRMRFAREARQALQCLSSTPLPQPLLGDSVEGWLDTRTAKALMGNGIRTLADLTLRVPRRRRWWVAIDGIGEASARRVMSFFDAHPELTARARDLVQSQMTVSSSASGAELVPWERMLPPQELDGSRGRYRGEMSLCTLEARNDYEALSAWIDRHESEATRRAYRKEVERLVLWAIFERGKAMSSLSMEDATAYRRFLADPRPAARWIGPTSPRHSPEWRPFASKLKPGSVKYALQVVSAVYGWLVAQNYVVANPFKGMRVAAAIDTTRKERARAFSAEEWRLIRTVADGLEYKHGWDAMAAWRIRFVLDFSYATGLRASELIKARRGDIRRDVNGYWISVVGKGSKKAEVTVPPLAMDALERYWTKRELESKCGKLGDQDLLVGRVGNDTPSEGIGSARLWRIVKRFFALVADQVEHNNPGVAKRLRSASPHWMRHTHATHALDGGADLRTVKDNLRHSSIQTTSGYLHSNEAKQASQLAAVFVSR